LAPIDEIAEKAKRRGWVAWSGIVAAGILLRALAAYPPFRSPLESDGTMTGLTALEILHRHLRIFLFHGVRLGALESYLHVPAFLVFGATRGALYLAPLLAGGALLVAYAFFARELLGEREGRVALLLLAVPPPMVLLWNYLPFGYAETLVCMAVALGCAVRIGRRGAVPWAVFGFGLAAGVGWWCSALSLMGTLPAALWLLLRRAPLLRRPGVLGLAAGGLALGALPWIAINLRYPLISFQSGLQWQSNFAFKAAGGLDQYLANAGRLAERFPGLLLRADCPRPALFGPLVLLAGALYLAALGLALAQAVSRRSWGASKNLEADGGRTVPAALLPLLIAACTALLFIASAAGGIEGDTVRYVLPLCLAAPLLTARLWARLDRRLGAALLLVLLAVHVSGYCLPGMPRREAERRQARSEDRLLRILAERRTAWVFGGYWDVYALNFLSGERIKAVPDLAWTDYHGYEQRLGEAPAPLALVSRRPGKVAAWAERAGLRGETVNVDGDFEAFFLAAPPPGPPAALAARLREAQMPDPLPPEACRSGIEIRNGTGAAPLVLAPGDRRLLPLRVTHRGTGAPWTSAVDLPGPGRAVRMGVRWFREGALVADQPRVELPRSPAPGEAVDLEVPLAARGADGQPLPPGRYEVRIGLVQELVRWFADAGDPGERRMAVEVR
jgi:hypothetical protein